MTRDAERVARELLARDPDLSGLEMSGAGLEEAFLTLTASRAESETPATAGVGGGR